MKSHWILLPIVFAQTFAAAQATWRPANRTVVVDEHGILRWQDNGEEVALFGVNYYAPFSIDYNQLKALGFQIEKVIDIDLLHLARMGLNLIRLHVWDREISDREGNLIDNEHLRLLDYLIAKAKERGIYTLLTPIAWWGTPNPSAGFSNFFTMQQMTTDLEARKAQRNYLAQFVQHVNRYTGLAYKDDPAIVGFELINEPLYPPGTTNEQVRDYINALAEAIRGTGCKKPLFYNGWDGKFAAVRDSIVDGCSFVWYPTGLVSGRSLKRNFLPLVDDYPSMRAPELERKAKIVYEFDAADVPGSYIYPAMARAFRSGGAQIAAQFQYDVLPLAPFNINWQTHYLNLVYTPNKAVSFIIAAEAFRRLPRLKTYGRYPENTRFGPFRVSYEEDLSEMVTEREFFYSNDTKTKPPSPEKLERIVGCGSSPIVRYEGTGAYFLEKLGDGVWRLEVYPDAVWVNDPYGRPSLEREVARVYWRERVMQVNLPDLGPNFAVEPLNEGNRFRAKAVSGTFTIRPGVYLLSRQSSKVDLEGLQLPVAVGLREFYAPPSSDAPVTVWHEPVREWVEGKPLRLTFTVASPREPERVMLYLWHESARVFRSIPLEHKRAYRYEATIPSNWLKPDEIEYLVGVKLGQKFQTFPADLGREPVRKEEFLEAQTIFALKEGDKPPPVSYTGPQQHKATSEIVKGSDVGSLALRLMATGFGEPPSCAGVRLKVRSSKLPTEDVSGLNLVVRARSLFPQTKAVEIGLVERDGSAYGYEVPLTNTWREIEVPLENLRPLWGTKGQRLRVSELAELSIIFGAWLYGGERTLPHGLEIERVAIKPKVWKVAILSKDAPIVLFSAERHQVSVRGDVPVRTSLVGGAEKVALRISVNGFGPPPSCVYFRHDVFEEFESRRDELAQCDTLVIKARAVTPVTTHIEVALIERDGTPWGTNVPLKTEWQEIRLPLSTLRHFAHWGTSPQGRGSVGDRFRPENVAAVNICFGAWLFPQHASEQHIVEIEEIALVKATRTHSGNF
ncbi:MAG: glycoside hydrolase family 5 protein [Armatimonadetes bacterium]|nr:glycoside hydrolase family 5 protein [Armatimonadota bacterium]